MWALLKIKVNNREPKTVKDLKTIVRKEWGDLQLEYAQNLVSILPKRLNGVLEMSIPFLLISLASFEDLVRGCLVMSLRRR